MTTVFRRLTLEESERVRGAFDAMAVTGPVTLEEVIVALSIAAWDFEAWSYNATPFYRLISRLTEASCMDLTRIPVSVPIVAEAQRLRIGRSLELCQAFH